MITVVLPYPPSANHYKGLRVVRPKGKPAFVQTYVTAEAKEYKEHVGWLLRAAGVKAPIAGRIAIAYTLYPKRPQDWQTRMRKLGDGWQDTVQCIDLDNAQKVLLDALKGIAFEDDAWVRRITAERAEPDGEARLVVTITPIETPQPQTGFDLAMPVADPLEV
jgi:crossover junction endodeoxyribonuclease RusA